jgi:hypothetical protein
LLENLLRCRCPSLQVCVQRLALSPKLRSGSCRFLTKRLRSQARLQNSTWSTRR